MGKAGEEYLNPWEPEIAKIGQEFSRALKIDQVCFYLYNDNDAKPDRFLGIDDILKRNAEILGLARDIVDGKVTYNDAIGELKVFSEGLFDEPEEKWEQLPLWSL